MASLDPIHAHTHSAFRGPLAERMALARQRDTAPELLVLLATDEVEAVRCAVAGNPGAPSHADRLLAQDADAPIRTCLARKLAARAGELALSLADRRGRLAWDALLLLAQDPRNEVRHAVADTLADLTDAPHDLVLALARDAVLLVCEPLIRLSLALTLEDLLALVREPPGVGSRLAVARRLRLSAPLCEAVVESGDLAAMAALLRNPTAQIPLVTLEALIGMAARHQALQEPLVCRPGLPLALIPLMAAMLADETLSQIAAQPEMQPLVEALSRARDPAWNLHRTEAHRTM